MLSNRVQVPPFATLFARAGCPHCSRARKHLGLLVLVKKELKGLHSDFGKLNEKVDDSTLLGI
jgi:glutaredoxin